MNSEPVTLKKASNGSIEVALAVWLWVGSILQQNMYTLYSNIM